MDAYACGRECQSPMACRNKVDFYVRISRASDKTCQMRGVEGTCMKRVWKRIETEHVVTSEKVLRRLKINPKTNNCGVD